MKIGLIGYGKMGEGIFKLLSEKGYHVTVLVRSQEKAVSLKDKIDKAFERALKKNYISETEFQQKKTRLRFTQRLEDLGQSDLVIESIVESMPEKLDLYRRLESVVSPETVIVTNTSSFSVADLANNLKHKERFCGLHFFYPVFLVNLIEVVRWRGAPNQLINFLVDFCSNVGKKAIVVNDAPGSAINSILAYYYIEGLYILEQGLTLPSTIDMIGKKIFFVGPCESVDVIGIDFFIETLARTKHARRPDINIPVLLYKLLSEKRIGKKNSKGIFIYQDVKAQDDLSGFYSNPGQAHSLNDAPNSESFLAQRLLYSIFNGCLYALEREISSLEELNIGIKEELYMKEGPFTMMRSIGIKKLKEEFAMLAQKAGLRFKQNNLEKLLY